jgi:hypothetical protein
VTARRHLDSQQGRVRVTDGAGRWRNIVLHGAMQAWCRTGQAHRHSHHLLCATFPPRKPGVTVALRLAPAGGEAITRASHTDLSNSRSSCHLYHARVLPRDEAGSPTPLCGKKLQQRRARCISAHRLRWAGPWRTRRRPCGRRRPAGGACVPARVADLRCARHPPRAGSRACPALPPRLTLAWRLRRTS